MGPWGHPLDKADGGDRGHDYGGEQGHALIAPPIGPHRGEAVVAASTIPRVHCTTLSRILAHPT